MSSYQGNEVPSHTVHQNGIDSESISDVGQTLARGAVKSPKQSNGTNQGSKKTKKVHGGATTKREEQQLAKMSSFNNSTEDEASPISVSGYTLINNNKFENHSGTLYNQK